MESLPVECRPSARQVPLRERAWRAGTLTYTFGGLISLFFILLLGDFAWAMRDRSIGPAAQWYLASLKVPNLLFALLLSSFPAVVGLVLTPVISVCSDRHRGPRGRRVPYLLITTFFATLGIVGIGLSPLIAKRVHHALSSAEPFGEWFRKEAGAGSLGTWLFHQAQSEVVVAVVCFGFFWASFEFAAMAGQSLFGGLVNDVVPTSLLGRFFGLFRVISLIDGIVFNYWIVGKIPAHFTLVLLSIGLFYGACFIWVCLKTREGKYPPPPAFPLDPAGAKLLDRSFLAVRGYLVECFSNPYYVAVFFLLVTSNLAFVPVNTFSMPFAASLGVPLPAYGASIALTYTISLLLAWPLGWLSDRLHPLRVVITTLALYLLVDLYGGFFATNSTGFLIAWVLHGVTSGCYLTGVASLSQRLFPRDRFAQFSSAVGVIASLAGIVIPPLMGGVLDFCGSVYRYTFLAGFLFALISLLFAWRVHLGFRKLGGPHNYSAPEPVQA